MAAELDRATARSLLDIVDENSATYQRIRRACSDDSALWPAELDYHAAAITAIAAQAKDRAGRTPLQTSATGSDTKGQ